MGTESARTEAARTLRLPHRWTRVDDPNAVAIVAAYNTVIAGAGPAGLTAAYELTKHGHPCVVLEADPRMVGGISRTDQYQGYRFDIGGHRFFSKSEEVNRIWREILGDELITRSRMSRIYYDRKFFHYPLKPVDALLNLGPIRSACILASYLMARLRPIRPERSFEDWVVNRFGRRLFEIFFKTYTEKVWGMSCKEISADWAAQRIKGLSLTTAALNALLPRRRPRAHGDVVKTLIDTFRYPRRGPGMMWEACAARVAEMGGRVRLGARVVGCRFDESTRRWGIEYEDAASGRSLVEVDHVISSAPIRELVQGLTPPMSEAARSAASALRYRDFLTVVLILKDRGAVTDNWIYVHDPGVRVGRVQNFKSWSPEMVPDPSMACYGLEYFCFEGDGLWNASDTELIELGRRELAAIGLAALPDIVDGCVVRQRKAYPVYDGEYARHVATIRNELATAYPRLHLVGRNGMHKYNNQDHAMMTALLCAQNILAGHALYDVWRVNEDAEYHESGDAGQHDGATGLRSVPTPA
jgi:protoporphyrinogen oxidase